MAKVIVKIRERITPKKEPTPKPNNPIRPRLRSNQHKIPDFLPAQQKLGFEKMNKISKGARRKIYNRVAMLFRRKAKSLGIPKKWKWEVKIDGLCFEEYLDKEIESYDPETAELTADEAIEEFKNRIQGMDTDRASGGTQYELNPAMINALNTEANEEHEREMKQIAREFNENVEVQIKRSICPRCRSSVCRCRD